MNHVWRLGRRGCIALVKDFNHFRITQCSDIFYDFRKCATRYAAKVVERWNNYSKLKPASARENAQKLQIVYGSQIGKINSVQPGRSGVAQMALLLSLKESTLSVRHRNCWTKPLQAKNAGMLPRGKKEYLWEELPAGNNNRRKEKAKPGSLNEIILFEGD